MLDNLVESKSNFQNTKRRGSYLVTTGFLVFSLFASGVLWSLFARDLDIGNDSLELSSIVAPVPMPEDVPPPPEPIKPTKQDNSPKTETLLPNRNENMARTDEPIIPKGISTTPNKNLARPNERFTISNAPETKGTVGRVTSEGPDGNSSKIISGSPTVTKTDTEEPPPTIKKAEPKIEKPKNTVVSKGVINGTATSLPKPIYPPAAKAVRASGDVNVQVTIDEKGTVISANAVTGHALLRQVSENAARNAKFKPTLLSDVPVKVTGVIVYKFSPQ